VPTPKVGLGPDASVRVISRSDTFVFRGVLPFEALAEPEEETPGGDGREKEGRGRREKEGEGREGGEKKGRGKEGMEGRGLVHGAPSPK